MQASRIVRLAAAAARDFRDIYAWTADRFGADQAEVYADTLSLAIDALQAGPRIMGVKTKDDIATGLRSVVLRILHDAMAPARHIRR